VALGLFAAGVVMRLFITLIGTRIKYSNLSIVDGLRIGIWLASIVSLVAVWSLYKSWKGLQAVDVSGELYYEFLYWGSGHVLQFNHSLLMLIAWLIILLLTGVAKKQNVIPVDGKWIMLLAAFSVVPVLDTFRIYAGFDIYTAEHRAAFTDLMIYGGLTTLPFGLFLAWVFVKGWSTLADYTLHRTILLCSALLFLTGGVIGFMIEGVNVVIPAHYHGSIVGVTLAFMGMAYLLMPYLGYAEVRIKLAKIQMIT
jgi:hypothetical protein